MESKMNQQTILRDVISSIKNGKAPNLPRFLEMLNTCIDVNMQVKVFSVLSAYLMFNDDNIEAIITFNPMYEKICQILANCPPRKTTVAFNFLSALVYADNEDNHRKSSLVAYAKNMIRSSGCLATMCDLFTTCMMHQDAWRALCRCLAESCRGVEANQSYCTHLVPLCIQRCSQRNIEVLLVLQSLLDKHYRNITLFMECNGISLFQKEFLQHDNCLQLLATIVQSSTEAVAIISKTGVCQQLRDFLQLYGRQSQLGQWATIVLYHTSKVEVPHEDPRVDEEKTESNKLSESLLKKLTPTKQSQEKDCSADTTIFFQNVMKELFQCSAQKESNHLKTFIPTNIMTNRRQSNTINYASKRVFRDISEKKNFWEIPQDPNLGTRECPRQVEHKFVTGSAKSTATVKQNDGIQYSKTNELSFSFLRKQNSNGKHVAKSFVKADKHPESFRRPYEHNESRVTNNTIYESRMEIDETLINTLCTNDFKPQFASTPKRDYLYKYSRDEKERSKLINYSSRFTQNSVRNHQVKRRLQKKRMAKHYERSKIDKEVKHKSFSGRFFDAINTSCTTLVKTVKNIFRPKSDDTHDMPEDSSNKTPDRDTLTCSYSFTEYMRRRDAAMKNDYTNSPSAVKLKPKPEVEDFSMEMSDSCNTCNDTITLKRKLVNDDHLKRTIRKLKLGINLYGCNFKKISRTMWPKENYMTPAVLYNLYRKLIIK